MQIMHAQRLYTHGSIHSRAGSISSKPPPPLRFQLTACISALSIDFNFFSGFQYKRNSSEYFKNSSENFWMNSFKFVFKKSEYF